MKEKTQGKHTLNSIRRKFIQIAPDIKISRMRYYYTNRSIPQLRLNFTLIYESIIIARDIDRKFNVF